MAARSGPVVCFGPFELNLQNGDLRKNGRAVRLAHQPARVLALLASRPGELISREEIAACLWDKETFVDFDHGLNFCIRQIRTALGDNAESPTYVETLPRRGYRFVAAVARPEPDGGESATAVIRPAVSPARLPRLALAAGALIACALLLVVVWYVYGSKARRNLAARDAAPRQRLTLAVLPFANLTGDPHQEYFSDGLTEEMITQLGSINPQTLGVIARTSTMHYKGSQQSASDIGRELGVDYLLEGSVRGSPPQRLRITAQLIQTRDQMHVWAEDFDVNGPDILEVESDVCRNIATEIELNLPPLEQQRLAAQRKVDPEAHDLYLRGRYEWNRRDPIHLQNALDLFQRSIARDPSYAPAYSGLADSYSLLGVAGYDVLPAAEAMEKARAAALKALALDDSLSEGHASLAFVLYSFDWNLGAAEQQFQKAIALNAGNATARQWYSELLTDEARWDDAIREANAAVAIDPWSPIIRENLARPYYYSRRFDTAAKLSQNTLKMDPDFAIAHLRLGREFAGLGDYEQAEREFHAFSDRSGDTSLALASLANLEGRRGHRARANALIDQLHTISRNHPVPAYEFAIAYAGVGNVEEELRWIQSAYEQRSDYLLTLNVEPLFDNLKTDARFRYLVHQLGLAASPAPPASHGLRSAALQSPSR